MDGNLDCTIRANIEKFEYLGSTIQIKGDINDCVIQYMGAMGKRRNLSRILPDKRSTYPSRLKERFHHKATRPALSHGSMAQDVDHQLRRLKFQI